MALLLTRSSANWTWNRSAARPEVRHHCRTPQCARPRAECGPSSRVTRATKPRIACFAAPSFQEGSGLVWARAGKARAAEHRPLSTDRFGPASAATPRRADSYTPPGGRALKAGDHAEHAPLPDREASRAAAGSQAVARYGLISRTKPSAIGNGWPAGSCAGQA